MSTFIHIASGYAIMEADANLEDFPELREYRREGGIYIPLNEESLNHLGETLRREIMTAISNLGSPTKPTVSKGKEITYSRPLVMGILNVTPDSFSDGGRYLETKRAIDRGLEMAEQGADIIDVGGESTRPGSYYVDAQTEMERVLPVVEALASTLDIPISVDTRKPAVAEKAIDRGALIVNDVSGLREEGMPELIASTGVAAVIMHMRATPKDMQNELHYDDVVHDVMKYLYERKEVLLDAGAAPSQIIIDPGLGFGKSLEHNLALIRRLAEFRALGLPILAGASRKSFIGKILGTETSDRLEGSLVAAAVAAINGADIIRAHDVSETVRAVCVAHALRSSETLCKDSFDGFEPGRGQFYYQ